MAQLSVNHPFTLPNDWLSDGKTESSAIDPRFLVLVTILAAGLRLFAIDSQSLWVDEIMTWEQIRPDIGFGFFTQMLDSIQGPLYQAILWPLIRFTDADWVMRLPAAIFGILAVPLLGITAARIFGNKSARLAALLLAVSPFHVWYSQEARGYSFLIFFSLLACAIFLEMVEKGPRFRLSLSFGLVSAFAVLSNMSGLFIWVACGICLLVFFRPRKQSDWWMWVLAFGFGLVMFAPWILKASGIWAVERIIPGAATGAALRGESTFSLLAVPYSLFTFFYGFSFGPSLAELHQLNKWAVLKPYLPLLFAGALPVGVGLLS